MRVGRKVGADAGKSSAPKEKIARQAGKPAAVRGRIPSRRRKLLSRQESQRRREEEFRPGGGNWIVGRKVNGAGRKNSVPKEKIARQAGKQAALTGKFPPQRSKPT